MVVNIVNIKMLLSVLLSTTGLFTYVEFVSEIDFTINGEVVYRNSSNNIKKETEKILQDYQNELLESSLGKVFEQEREYIDKTGEVLPAGEVEIIKYNDYKYDIVVTHEVNRSVTTEIPFDKETKKDDGQFVDYKKVTTAGVNGKTIETYTVKYINGIETDIYNQEEEIVDAITEVTTIGTKEYPTNNGGGYNNGGSYNNGGGNYGGGNYGGGNNGGGNKPLGQYPSLGACESAGSQMIANNGGNGGWVCLDAGDGSYTIFFFE